ncbi:hypothetical protein DFH27DRAFT_628388 [Peziza echinospora]|nr:hypothetical protein DFH27DRAFT_628388 [Peziza echinospora]
MKKGKIDIELCKTQHRNLVNVQHVFENGVDVYLIIQYMDVCLTQIIACHKFTEPQIAVIVRNVLDGLCFIEALGFKHGIIKTSEVLLSSSGEIRLANWMMGLKAGAGTITDPSATSTDAQALGTLAVQIMNRTDDYPNSELDKGCWSSQGSNFIASTSFADLATLSRHAFLSNTGLNGVDLINCIMIAKLSTKFEWSLSGIE